MPHVEANGVRMHYRWDGPTDAPILAFSNSLGTNVTMWDAQAAVLGKRFRILRYDTRGHGGSSIPGGPYSIDQLAGDFLALLDAIGIAGCSFCGLSMGGMIGMWIAVHHPKRLNKLMVANSAAKIGSADTWNPRIARVRNEGMNIVASEVIARWFTPDFRKQQPDKVIPLQRMLESTNPAGYAACCEAIRDMDQRAAVGSITLPTLIISGESDPVTPPAEGNALAHAIKNAKHITLKAAHLSNIERSEEFTDALASFLEDSNA